MALHLRPLNSEVYVFDDLSVKVGRSDIEFLKEKAVGNARKRVRLCAHKQMDDAIHEMIVVFARGAYPMPHKHMQKIESYHMIEGMADFVLFDETGNMTDVTRMGDYPSGLMAYYRTFGSHYHTFSVRSEFLVFHETTNGPFEKSETIPAPWAPKETDGAEVGKFMEQLRRAAERFGS